MKINFNACLMARCARFNFALKAKNTIRKFVIEKESDGNGERQAKAQAHAYNT